MRNQKAHAWVHAHRNATGHSCSIQDTAHSCWQATDGQGMTAHSKQQCQQGRRDQRSCAICSGRRTAGLGRGGGSGGAAGASWSVSSGGGGRGGGVGGHVCRVAGIIDVVERAGCTAGQHLIELRGQQQAAECVNDGRPGGDVANGDGDFVDVGRATEVVEVLGC